MTTDALLGLCYLVLAVLVAGVCSKKVGDA